GTQSHEVAAVYYRTRSLRAPSMDLSVDIAGVRLENPVLAASGTFGYGTEFEDIVNLRGLGGIVTKGLSRAPMAGNPSPRLCETAAGMLNSVGLQNIGAEAFVRDRLPRLRQLGVLVIANIFGESVEDYVAVIETLNQGEVIAAYELNASCPNTRFLGMAIDVESRRPRFARGVAGLSGPAIKPLALRMVYEAHRAVAIPIIGMGGIANGQDAVEFLLAGAGAVAVGTSNFWDPKATENVLRGLRKFCRRHGIESVRSLIGALEFAPPGADLGEAGDPSA